MSRGRVVIHMTYASNDLLAEHGVPEVWLVELADNDEPQFVHVALSQELANVWAIDNGYEIISHSVIYNEHKPGEWIRSKMGGAVDG